MVAGNLENLEFDNFEKKKPGILNNFNMFSSKISIWHKNISYK